MKVIPMSEEVLMNIESILKQKLHVTNKITDLTKHIHTTYSTIFGFKYMCWTIVSDGSVRSRPIYTSNDSNVA